MIACGLCVVNVQAFGANSQGQLGLGDAVDRWKPTRVKLPNALEEEKCCLRVVQVGKKQEHCTLPLASVCAPS